jgi:two-component system, chemotaxis family, CheB/CheR fusion protein
MAEPNTAQPRAHAAQRPTIVGIGASAGGLDAFIAFFSTMPSASGMAFVLVQHLDPNQPSLLPELLAPHTTMSVSSVADQMVVEANHVYLIPPNTALTVEQGALRLALPTEAHGHRLPIDHFFQSLAADQGPRAVGIVLSGSGSDGTLGLLAIRERGGMTLAQEPATAAFDSMPQSAIARGVVDYVLPIDQMPAALLARPRPAPPAATPSQPAASFDEPATAAQMQAIYRLLSDVTGHDFSHYKLATLQRRIARRMELLQIGQLALYVEHLRQQPTEVELLFQDLLINVTHFFRDPQAFEALAELVLPQICHTKDGITPVRVWVPGCASGEEAYTVAILLHEQLDQLDKPPPMQIFATDIDEQALEAARQGHYNTAIESHVSAERLARYFTRTEHGYQIAKRVREGCIFSLHNLISDPPFARIDLIVCRNLLIYFDADLQRRLLPLLHYALVPGGYLFLGSSESVTVQPELFRTVDKTQRLFQRKELLVRQHVEFPLAEPGHRSLRQLALRRAEPGPALAIGTTFDQILLKEYAPPAVVVNDQGQIVYFSGRTRSYLEAPSGTPTLDVLAMVHPQLRLTLQAALRTSARDRTAVVHENLAIEGPGGVQRLNLIVRPLSELGPEGGLLVVFQELGPPLSAFQARTVGLVPQIDEPFAEQLAQELLGTREALEAVIAEQHETNTELTSANEELSSLNEELQSANEELQTSKEEIQSINEELQTVNAELNRKVDELDRANGDLQNIFESTQIPAVFLHAFGQIARFTPTANEVFRLISSDIGRPISDIVPRFRSADLATAISSVQKTLVSHEEPVRSVEGDTWWMMRIRPYRTLANVIEGVVITFSDITGLKRTEAEREDLLVAVQQAHAVLESRVQERTSELAASNAALQSEIAERRSAERSRQMLLQQLLTAQEEERRRIARELHDQMGQDLSALIMGLRAVQDASTSGPPVAQQIEPLYALAVQLSQEVRTLAVQLRPPALDDLGLAATLANYLEQWSQRMLIAVDFHTSGMDKERLPPLIETALYRLAQEALTNVLKHAQATSLSLIIDRRADSVQMIVEDNGVGFQVELARSSAYAEQRFGLIGMDERVAQLGGTLNIESAPQRGTTVFVRIPLALAT